MIRLIRNLIRRRRAGRPRIGVVITINNTTRRIV
jgi:hypothetical protein